MSSIKPHQYDAEIPRVADLENWTNREWSDGVQIERLADLDNLVVKTRNSIYEITIIAGSEGEVLVRGGQYFPEKTPAHLSGATFGGSFVKMRGIYLGMNMEIMQGRRRIVTSPVQSIAMA